MTATTAAPLGSREGQPVQSSVTRDDIVRAVMPELQVLVRHLVETNIERALAPLLDKQRELESTIKELRNAQARPQPAPVVVPVHKSEHRPIETQPITTVTRPAQLGTPEPVVRSGAATLARYTPNIQHQVLNAAILDTTPLEDIPLELNGSRRKKAILWAFGVTVLLALASAVVLSVLSNQGTYL